VQISVLVSILSGIERLRAQFFTVFHKVLRTGRKCGQLNACCFSDKPEVDDWFYRCAKCPFSVSRLWWTYFPTNRHKKNWDI